LVPCLAIIGQIACAAVSSQNVLVLYNPAWSDGTHDGSYIANYYASSRGIPSSNVIGLTGLGTGEDISATDYLNVIWPQVESALQTRNISTIVTTKGLPLRITNDMPNPAVAPDYSYTYTDASGVQRTLYNDTWQTYSSLESELTRINTIGIGDRNSPNWPTQMNTALVQMGDNTYWNASASGSPNPTNNPYYLSTTSFSHTDPAVGGMYLTARLDGYTVADVTTAINKAKNVYLLPIANSSYVVIDNDPNADVADQAMVQQLKNVLASSKQAYTYDSTTAAVTTAPGPVIGYDSQGVHATGVNQNYILNLKFSLANGAVFNTHESYNAYTFNCQPGNNPMGQGLVADWLAIGGTAGIGNVQEPQNGPDNEANEDQMLKMLLDGKTWGEAAWSSLLQLSYVNTVIGDPLMTWKQVLPGDANKDGKVTAMDLNILSTNWMATGQAGGAMWSRGDFNGDGKITALDVNILATNWGRVSSWASGGVTGAAESLNLDAFYASVPEPSTIASAIACLTTLLVVYGFGRIRPFA
jgi:uncharacterized protein (TIGR03790 family)